MSSETADARAFQAEDVVAYAERYGHIALVGLLMVFMVWVRMINLSRFRNDNGTIALTAIDSFYHWRTTDWTVQNFPWTMPYEVYTGFPDGNYVGQFGTLFDQLIALVAYIIGLGSPTQSDIHLAALIVVPVLAALVAIPVYLITKKLSGENRFAAVAAVVVLALSPGEFLRRSTTGWMDHNVAEVLFMAVAVYAMIVALRATERDKPIWELVRARDWEPLKPTAKYAAIAGLTISLYLWTWPPGVVFVGILGVFFAVQLSLDFVRGVSPDHVAFVGAISMAVPAFFGFLLADVYSFGVTAFGLLQPLLALLVAIGCVFMAWLAREWDDRDIERVYYPAAIAGLAVAGLLVLSLVAPEFYSTLMNNLTSRLLPLDPSTTGLTVQEVQPPEDFVERATMEFGMGLYLLIIGLVLLAARPFIGQRYRAEHTLLIVWTLFLTGMAMTQVRFWYYYVLPIAILSGYTLGQVITWIDLKPTDTLRDVEAYQVLTILLVVTVLFVPFAPMFNSTNAVAVGESASPSHDSELWTEPNAYMQENTPEPGNLYGAGNSSQLDYYGSYNIPSDEDFDYPRGAYGVMSWWDYGHLITTQGERIPHANPFQQHARSASAFLQAPSEEAANEVLDAIAAGQEPRLDANGNVTVDTPEDGDEEIPYVMIDYKMASSKFNAITQWTGPDVQSYLGQTAVEVQGEEQGLPAFNDAYYDTQLASLYIEDTQGMEHYRLIHEADRYAYVGGMISGGGATPLGSADQGSNWNQSRQLAAQVQQSNNQDTLYQNVYEGHVVSTVKSYERVEGATLSGSFDEVDPENATATVRLGLETNTGRTFTYTQEAEIADDGSFEVTVPYATNDELGPDEGYTDSAVTATGSYDVIVSDNGSYYRANATVDEPAIYEGDTVQVDGFEETSLEELLGINQSQGSDNATDTGGETGDEGDNTSDGDDSSERVGIGGVRVAGR